MIFRTTYSPFQTARTPAALRTFAPAISLADRAAWSPQVNGGWSDDGYQLRVDLPGVPESAVHVSVAGRTLTLEVDVETTSDDEHRQLRWSERLRLPQTLDPEQVAARYRDGRLTVTIGRTVQPEARTIAIDTSAPAVELTEATEATATEAMVEVEAGAPATADAS